MDWDILRVLLLCLENHARGSFSSTSISPEDSVLAEVSDLKVGTCGGGARKCSSRCELGRSFVRFEGIGDWIRG